MVKNRLSKEDFSRRNDMGAGESSVNEGVGAAKPVDSGSADLKTEADGSAASAAVGADGASKPEAASAVTDGPATKKASSEKAEGGKKAVDGADGATASDMGDSPSAGEGGEGAAEKGEGVDSYAGVRPVDANEVAGGLYGVEYGLDAATADSTEFDESFSFADELGTLPEPDVFNAYPPEVQRKIMEWTDRDIKARRDDESRRRDDLARASVERERRNQIIPAAIIVLALLCGTITGIVTGNPLFPIAFLIVPLAVIGARLASGSRKTSHRDKYRS